MIKVKKLRKRKGFTLIEMVIVITIIGILSSIAVTKYSKIQENAKKNADYATAANLATAAMISLSDGNTSVTPESLAQGGYIQFIPKSKYKKDESFIITPDKNGDSVIVTVDSEQFYPKPGENTQTSGESTQKSE